ncbi:Ribokinase-like [Phytophthora cactorum]|nr:Ribokinase-like [Phytophthora cactorum]
MYGRVKRPVVALESTIISHGMPFPQNLHMAKHVEEDLTQLAELGAGAKKCSTRDIAAAVTDKKVVGATTVSSTMRIAHAAGIKVFVTGGIGGVHRFCEETMDISTDLMELSRTPVAVVCAGVKSFSISHEHWSSGDPCTKYEKIMNLKIVGAEPSTMFSVPVIGYKTDQFPAFFTQDSGEKAHLRRDTPQDLARLIHESEALGLPNGHIIAVPNPKPVPSELINEAIEKSSTTSSGKRVLVVGGLVLDIISSSTSPLIRGTSNIGTIKQSSGGVGRNIAECLHRLRLDPLLVSSIGNDASGSILLDNLKKLGMNTSGINISDNLSTAVYSAVLDSTGDMDAAIADMSAFDRFEAISDKAIDRAKLVIADGNLVPATIGDLFKRSARLDVDTWFEPTSVQKAIRVVEGGGVSSMKYMSPNADELHAISTAIRQKVDLSAESNEADERFPLTKESGIIRKEEMTRLKKTSSQDNANAFCLASTALLAMADGDTKRPKHVMVTLGKHGALVASINMSADDLREIVEDCDFDVEIWGMHHVHGGHSVTMAHLPGMEIPVRTALELVRAADSACDSMVGGTVYGLLEGYDILQSCHMGMIAARKSLASEHAINPELAPQVLYSEP